MGSAEMQKILVTRLDRHIRMLPDPAREAHFAVLQSATIPSVLVEMGFMSNRIDERLLRQPRHRAVIAAVMADAVERYFTVAHNAGLFSG
jgi:N-acetylmuramoyl-L-alanine amidase